VTGAVSGYAGEQNSTARYEAVEVDEPALTDGAI
jgi:hypothetical protein